MSQNSTFKPIPTAQEYIDAVRAELERNADAKIAAGQKAYMKNKFEFFGIPSPQRKLIHQSINARFKLPTKQDADIIVQRFWEQPQREYQYLAQDLLARYVRKFEIQDIDLFQKMIVNKSWWDTVDFIAANSVGQYFKIYPEQKDVFIQKWLDSNNIWLQRTAVLYQLKYKSELNTKHLTHIINSLLGSKEFFINKSIGWVLREYAKTNSEWVLDFVNKTPLENLSRREALKRLTSNQK